MAEELQFLLDRIQSEGVAKADAKAAGIVAAAEKKAAEIVAAAEKAAAEKRAAAEADAATLRARAEASLRQAARDVVLSVRKDVQETLGRLVAGDVRAVLSDPDFLARYVETVAKSALAEGAELHVPPAEESKLAEWAKARLAAEMAKGLRIAPDRDVAAGIRVMAEGGRVEHDFTDKAVVEALSRSVRPALAKIAFGD